MAGRQKEKKLIADQDILLGETNTREDISVLPEEDLLARNLRKKAAIDQLDRSVTDKVAWKKVGDMDFVDEELQRIAQERQSLRESFNTQRKPRGKTKKEVKTRKVVDEEADTKIDAGVDLFFARSKSLQKKAKDGFLFALAFASNKWSQAKAFGSQKYIVLFEKMSPVLARIELLKQKEALLSEKTAIFVGRLDEHLDLGYDKAAFAIGECDKKQRFFRCWAEKYKKPLFAGFAAATAAAAAITLLIGSMTAYEYMYNGKTLGVVKDQKDVFAIVDAIGDKLTYAYGAEVNIDKDENLSFKKVVGWDIKTDSQEEILDTFTYMSDMNAKGFAIKVEGKQVALLDSKETANEVLESLKARFTKQSDTIKYKSIGFSEAVEIESVETKIKNIQAEDTALEYMLTGATEKKVHVVQSGETFGEIAKIYGLKSRELEASNPEVTPEKLQIGQELVLTQICPVLTVATTEIATYNTKIDYDVTYQETSTLYKGEQTVKSSGVNGQKEVVAEIVRENGIEVSRKEIRAKVLSEPVSQVVLKGTKPVPALIGTGTYVYPVRGGRLSSRYGSRWGRMHYGIDLAASSGTWIYASDGGTVIDSGYERSFGKVVRISHGGNRVTVYAHCSKLFVSAGDKVFQGQHIANVGSTGNSTGPHLHFEVRINGVAKNPLSYI
ncbi:MAG: peptidoglycan DD-metalloendopeptidase family protein [Eubacteriales bacterium]|nr:peptidoglycan DD-metalloendopeptidase family protein [Eubacteriales bacterium]